MMNSLQVMYSSRFVYSETDDFSLVEQMLRDNRRALNQRSLDSSPRPSRTRDDTRRLEVVFYTLAFVGFLKISHHEFPVPTPRKRGAAGWDILSDYRPIIKSSGE